MTSYPPGAISSLEELKEFLAKPVFIASKEFKSLERFELKGFGTTTYKWGEYDFLENWNKHQRSQQDCNLPKLNGYNDWFVFSKEDDARSWAERKETENVC